MPDLVLLRHGESTWNAENRFTGWTDVALTAKGETEARQAGTLLAEEAARGLRLDVVHTSVLTRSVRTANLALDTLDRVWLPVQRHWRLNERHYGALQGLNKRETTEKFGKDQVMRWRRSYDVPPPPLARDDPTHPVHDERYHDVPPAELPDTECLADVVDRMLPYWREAIAPDLRKMRGVFVVAHGNSIRALVKYLKDISDEDIVSLEVPTGVPWLFRLDDGLTPVEDRQLGDPEANRAAADAVRRQAG